MDMYTVQSLGELGDRKVPAQVDTGFVTSYVGHMPSWIARLEAYPHSSIRVMRIPLLGYAFVFAVGIFSHWPALFTDSIMWDDYLILAWITQGRFDWLYQFYSNYGLTPMGLVYLPFVTTMPTASTAILVAKFLCVASVLLNAALVMLISVRVAHGNRNFAVLAGATAAAFPGMSGESFQLTFLLYCFFVPVFLLGILLFIETALSPTPKPIIRVAAIVALLLSFSLNSLLAFFYALVPAVFYASLGREQTAPRQLIAAGARFLLRHLDFLAAPLVFWAAKEILMPRVGMYARYNAFRFDWAGILQAYERLVPDMLQTVLFVPLSIPLATWFAAAVFIIAALAVGPILPRLTRDSASSATELTILLGLGCLALIGAAFPYYLVGRRSIQIYGFMSRDNVLFPLGVSWVTAALTSMLLRFRWPRGIGASDRVQRLVQRAGIAGFCALLAAQSLLNWRNHADWQAHYAYYRSVIDKVVRDKNVVDASVVEVIDQLPGDRTLRDVKYPTSIWTSVLTAAFQKTARLAIPFPPVNGSFYTPQEISQRLRDTEVAFMFSDIDLNGQQSRLVVAPGKGARDPIPLALAYWRARFLAPGEMRDLLQSLTELTSSRLAGS
jgi:hypothetical protein